MGLRSVQVSGMEIVDLLELSELSELLEIKTALISVLEHCKSPGWQGRNL